MGRVHRHGAVLAVTLAALALAACRPLGEAGAGLDAPPDSVQVENVASDDGPIVVARTTRAFWGTRAAAPHLGRAFQPVDFEGPASVALLSYEHWASRLRADGSVIGRSIRLAGQRFTIVGVMPAGAAPRDVAAWIPDR
jgi:hypothetical protein